MTNIIIRHSFRDVLPKLTTEEFTALETAILAEGIRDPLVLWNDILVDGHNRYEIACKHGLTYKTVNMQFESDIDAEIWIRGNQSARRNFTDEQRAYNIGKLYELNKKKQGGTGANQYTEQRGQSVLSAKTAEDIGKQFNISGKTVKRFGQYSKAVDSLPEIKDKVLSGKIKATHEDIEKLSKYEPEKQRSVVEKVVKGEAKTVKEAEIQVKKETTLKKLQNSTAADIGNGEILEGDIFSEIKKVKNHSVDLLFADPPYMLLQEDWDYYANLDNFMKFSKNWLDCVIPKIKLTGRIYISFSQYYQYDLHELFRQNNFYGFNFGQTIIWNYKNNNKPSDRKLYRFAYEPIFYLYGPEADVLNFPPETYGETQSNVWTIATPQSNFAEGKYHPAQKPLELLERIILTGSKENDTVLDPFAGSGTTGIAAKKLGRKYILIESDSEYCKIAKGRISGVA